MIFVEPGLQDPASLVPCFATESSGLRLAAFTILPVEAVCVAEANGVGSRDNTARKLWIDWKNLLRLTENH